MFSLNAYQNYSDNDYKVNIDSYTKFNEDGSNQEVKENLTVRRFHAKYHNEVAILKIGNSGQNVCRSSVVRLHGRLRV